jgi:hypothetical protein
VAKSAGCRIIMPGILVDDLAAGGIYSSPFHAGRSGARVTGFMGCLLQCSTRPEVKSRSASCWQMRGEQFGEGTRHDNIRGPGDAMRRC